MAARRARIAALSSLVALGALALGAGAAWWKRCELTEWIARRALVRRGVAAELRVERLDAHGAEVAGLSLADAESDALSGEAVHDVELDRLALAWSLEGLRARRLDRIALQGLRLRARVDAEGVHLGAVESLLGRGSGSAAPLTLPFLEATLADASAVIDSPQGTLRLNASGNATPEGDLVRATLALRGESPQGTIEFGGGGTIGLASREIAAAGALSGVTPWGRAEGSFRALGSLAALRVELAAGAQPDEAALGVRSSEPIRITGVVTRDEAGLGASGTFSARDLALKENAAAREISGDFAFREEGGVRTGEASFAVSSPAWSGLGGAARAEGTARLRGDEVDVDATLHAFSLPDLARADSVIAHASLALGAAGIAMKLEAPRALAPGVARLDGVVAMLRLVGDALDGNVAIARLVELSQPALIAPLRLGVDLSGSSERVGLSGKAQTPGDGLVFDFNGSLLPETGRIDLTIVLPETDLALKTRQPQRVFPWLGGLVTGAAGRIGGQALASYQGGALSASASIAFNGTDVRTPQATIRGLTGVVSVIGPEPLLTPPGQLLWMRGVETAFPLAAGSVRFELLPEGVVRIERGEWSLAGGQVSLAGDLALGAADRLIELRAAGVALDQLLAALDFEGLAGTGVLEGTIPIRQRGDRFFVENGVLRAVGDGVVRFTSGEGGAVLAKRQPAITPVLGALANLHYNELTLTLNGELTDRPGLANRLDVKVQVKGRNPNFQKGQSVILNVNVDLPLSLLRSALLTAEVAEAAAPEDVRKALKAFGATESQ